MKQRERERGGNVSTCNKLWKTLKISGFFFKVTLHKFGYCCYIFFSECVLSMNLPYLSVYGCKHIPIGINFRKKQAISWSVLITCSFIICFHKIERGPKYYSSLASVFISFPFSIANLPQIEFLWA